MDEVAIREANKGDLNSLIKLYKEYDIYENKLDKRVEIDSISEIRKRTLKFFRTKKVRIFVMEEKGKVVAFVDWSVGMIRGVKRGTLHNINVTKDARGKGYGTILVDYLFSYFKKRGCKEVYSFVRGKNVGAQKFWRKKGFDLSENGYHMNKKL